MSATGARPYRRNRLTVLAASDMCWLCGHGGATTTDHIIPRALWPAGKPGVDDVSNLAPSHGTMGNEQPSNPCPVCGLLCNQVRGASMMLTRPQSREW